MNLIYLIVWIKAAALLICLIWLLENKIKIGRCWP